MTNSSLFAALEQNFTQKTYNVALLELLAFVYWCKKNFNRANPKGQARCGLQYLSCIGLPVVDVPVLSELQDCAMFHKNFL